VDDGASRSRERVQLDYRTRRRRTLRQRLLRHSPAPGGRERSRTARLGRVPDSTLPPRRGGGAALGVHRVTGHLSSHAISAKSTRRAAGFAGGVGYSDTLFIWRVLDGRRWDIFITSTISTVIQRLRVDLGRLVT
jgi:hypothetical protein